mmetsp:Transcript_1156/g.2625  ORF Transcript_1156/g.2625 Transcript_1156/m.2625 type:complete len:414 (-) Transcript_1156:1965-3206(-)
MTDQGDSSEENHTTGINGDDERSVSSVSDSSSSSSSSLPSPVEEELPVQGGRAKREVGETFTNSHNAPRDSSDRKPHSPPRLFNPNEKGTKKQKRCDYDSDSRSYEGLGFEYRRKNLPTTARRDTLLPDETRMINFDHQGNKKWGTRLLFETLDESEIDSLIGLATQQTKPLSNPSTYAFHNPQRRNPLVSATYDAPLPPSHLDYIKSRIRHNVFQHTSDDDEDRSKGGKVDSKGKNTETPFDDSAVVAMGMYLEECITASLLPLAGLHALRCQALEAMESAEAEFGAIPVESFRNDRAIPHPVTGEMVKLDMKNQIRWKEENAFQEWTLPPEEAILKLVEQGVLPKDSPYQFVPDASRSWTSTSSNEVPNRGTLDMETWAKSYNVNPKVVSANTEIYGVFLPYNTTALDKES